MPYIYKWLIVGDTMGAFLKVNVAEKQCKNGICHFFPPTAIIVLCLLCKHKYTVASLCAMYLQLYFRATRGRLCLKTLA